MHVQEAIDIVNSHLVYKPGWVFVASDHTNRFQDSIVIHVTYEALNSNRDLARQGYPELVPGGARASFPIMVGDMDREAFHRCLLERIVDIETHEAREFMRFRDQDFRSPFHPHRLHGIHHFGHAETEDLLFGVA